MQIKILLLEKENTKNRVIFSNTNKNLCDVDQMFPIIFYSFSHLF